MKRHVTVGVLAVLMLMEALGVRGMVVTSSAANANNPEVFSNLSIKGVWGFAGGPGFLVPPFVPTAVPIAGVGIVEFDGAGGCLLTTTVNVNGTTFGPLTSSACTYSVNPDGTGSSVARFSDGPILAPVPVSFVIVDNKKEIQFIQTAVIVGSFIGKRQ